MYSVHYSILLLHCSII